jgi:hypothetical protein
MAFRPMADVPPSSSFLHGNVLSGEIGIKKENFPDLQETLKSRSGGYKKTP